MYNKVAKIVTIAARSLPSAETAKRLLRTPVFYAAVAFGLLTSFGVSEAARRHHVRHHATDVYAKDTARCDLDKDYYATHSQWCDSAEKQHLVTIHHRQTVPAVQFYEQVTVRRDTQANTEVGRPDQFIALQTTADVAQGGGYGSSGSIWSPGALALGTQHLISKLAYAVTPQRPAVRTAVAPTQHPTRVSTNGGPVYITNSRVTVAQQ
jgi:hypothetical protein